MHLQSLVGLRVIKSRLAPSIANQLRRCPMIEGTGPNRRTVGGVGKGKKIVFRLEGDCVIVIERSGRWQSWVDGGVDGQ